MQVKLTTEELTKN